MPSACLDRHSSDVPSTISDSAQIRFIVVPALWCLLAIAIVFFALATPGGYQSEINLRGCFNFK